MIKAGEFFPQPINFDVKSFILVEMLRTNGLKNYRQVRLQSNDEIRATIKEGVYLVVCYMHTHKESISRYRPNYRQINNNASYQALTINLLIKRILRVTDRFQAGLGYNGLPDQLRQVQ